jgi:hypothetical protein
MSLRIVVIARDWCKGHEISLEPRLNKSENSIHK